jgi:2-polyprenyl-3-methyl-5-hydroxy-6-metoxy-1,4-benzoquinol methylase
MRTPNVPAGYDVFLSHSSVDKPWVIKLKEDLIHYGISAWLDKDEIQPGTFFAKALEEALENCRAVALVVSPEAIQSGWVEEEYYRALALAKSAVGPVKIIPVIFREAKLPGFLMNRNWVDFQDNSKYAENVWNLVWGITGQKPPSVIPLVAPVAHPVRSPLAETQESMLLWRLAYAFLRLDQLPLGGWARSLPTWYQTLTNNTEEGRARAVELRKIGGMNLTCLAMLNYTRALCSVLGKRPEDVLSPKGNMVELREFLNELDQIERRNGVGHRVVAYIEGRINIEGAIPDQFERSTDKDVQHTLLGIIVLLLAYLIMAKRCRPSFYVSLTAMCKYLDKYGRHVKLRAGGRRYEIYCVLKFLEHLLQYDFFKTEDPDVSKELRKLPEILTDIHSQVAADGISSAYPEMDKNASGCLINLPFLWSLSGSDLLETNPNFTADPLSDIYTDPDDLVMCTLGGRRVGLDWGHTAAYWWARSRVGESEAANTKRSLQTLVAQIDNHQAFSLTHGVSFSCVLGICNPLSPQALQELDQKVDDVLKFGATERNILDLILWIYHQEHPDLYLLHKDMDKDQETLEAFRRGDELYFTINKIKNLFIDKLKPGYYLPVKAQEELYKSWQAELSKSSVDTNKFFESHISDLNTSANEQRLASKKWFHLFKYLEDETVALDDWILDAGCGSGIHAIKQFLPKGYRVHFFDFSRRILDQLQARLDAEQIPADRYQFTQEYLERLPSLWEYRASTLKAPYKIIFADGVLFHISKEPLKKILGCFYEMLGPGGFFFANFKINDHSLIAMDGRRFEYFANHDEIQRMIEDAGFHVNEVTLTRKITSMYNGPYPTQWAHFISSKR